MQRIVNILTKTRGSKTFAYALSYVSQIKNVSSIRYFCLDEYRLGSRKILKNLFVKRRKSIIVSKLVFACININVNQRDTLTKCIINRTLSNVEIFPYRLYIATLKLFFLLSIEISPCTCFCTCLLRLYALNGVFHYNHKTCRTRIKYI